VTGLVLLGAIGLVGLVVVIGVLVPDMPGDAFDVHILNDGGGPVSVAQCVGSNGTCDPTEVGISLGRGEFAVASASVNAANPWIVRDASGRSVGCLPLRFTSYPPQTPTVKITAATMSACP
jgi:hypothetical protein